MYKWWTQRWKFVLVLGSSYYKTWSESLFSKWFDGQVIRCVPNQNGNHVIKKRIHNIPIDWVGFMFSCIPILGQVSTLSIHPYGSHDIQVLRNQLNNFFPYLCFSLSASSRFRFPCVQYKGICSVLQMSISCSSLPRRCWNQYASFARTSME